MRARTRADLALVLRIAEFLVGVDVVLPDAELVVTITRPRVEKPNHCDPGRRRRRQRGGDALLEQGRLEGLEQAVGLGAPQAWASTSRITSAGLAEPSLFRRARMPASSASTRLMRMPVALLKLA